MSAIFGEMLSFPQKNGPEGLFRLFGGSNGTDFLAFRLAFLGTSPVFDFDGDGTVTGADFLAFRLRFLQSI